MLSVELLLQRSQLLCKLTFLCLFRLQVRLYELLLVAKCLPMVLVNFRLGCELLALGLALLCLFEFTLSCKFLLLLLQLRLAAVNLSELVINVLDLSVQVVQLITLVVQVGCEVHQLYLERILFVL